MPRDNPRNAVAQLFETYGSHVYRTALAVTRDPGAADDVTQEVFVTLLKRDTPLGAGTLASADSGERRYLTRMTVNRCLNVLRDRKLRGEREGASPGRAFELDTSDTDLESLRTTLDGLDDKWRIPIVMRFFGGLKLEEISEELGLPHSTVHSRLERGLEAMRGRLVAQGFGVLVPMLEFDLTRLTGEAVSCPVGFIEHVVSRSISRHAISWVAKSAVVALIMATLVVSGSLIWKQDILASLTYEVSGFARTAREVMNSTVARASTWASALTSETLSSHLSAPSSKVSKSRKKKPPAPTSLDITIMDLPNRTRSDTAATLDNTLKVEGDRQIPLIRQGSGILVTHLTPVAHAGEDGTVASGSHGVGRVHLDGSASLDPDGTLAQFLWLEKGFPIAHGERVELDMTPGIHEIALQVFDEGSPPLSDDDSVVIRVLAPGEGNAPPVADAGPDLMVPDEEGDGFEFVELDGDGSLDDGGIATWEWIVGGQSAGFGKRLRLRLATGKHSVTLRVADGGDPALRDTDELAVTVGGENLAPNFWINSPASITADATNFALVECTAFENSAGEEDHTSLEYVWDWKGEGGAPMSTMGQRVNIPLPVGTHLITLKVTDRGSPPMTGHAEATVVVTPFGNSPPQPVWNPFSMYTAGTDGLARIEADASASVDPNGDAMVNYRWELVSGNSLIPLGTGSTSQLSLPIGSHSVRLSILDAGVPALTGSRDFSVTVQPRSNAPPTARLIVPGSVQASDGSPTATVRLDASSSSDPDGDTLFVFRWILVTGSVQTLLHEGPESAIDAEIPLGSHQIRLQVEDDMLPSLMGETSTYISISSAGNDPPLAMLGTYTSLDYMWQPLYLINVNGLSAITDVGNASDWRAYSLTSMCIDPDGDPLSLKWEFRNPNGSWFLMATQDPLTSSCSVGAWTYRLTATDPLGASNSLVFTITITQRP